MIRTPCQFSSLPQKPRQHFKIGIGVAVIKNQNGLSDHFIDRHTDGSREQLAAQEISRCKLGAGLVRSMIGVIHKAGGGQPFKTLVEKDLDTGTAGDQVKEWAVPERNSQPA